MPILLLLNLAFHSPIFSFIFLFHKSQLEPLLFPPFQPSSFSQPLSHAIQKQWKEITSSATASDITHEDPQPQKTAVLLFPPLQVRPLSGDFRYLW